MYSFDFVIDDEYEIYTKLTAISTCIALVARVGVCKVLETDLWGGSYNCVAGVQRVTVTSVKYSAQCPAHCASLPPR